MRNITENFNLENNFWECNPQFKIVYPFKELYNNDKSKLKKHSSNIMWAIALCYHPDSDLYNIKDKEVRVFDMVKDDSFKLENYKQHILEFKDMTLTEAQKSLTAWDERIKDRDNFLKEQVYTFDAYTEEGKNIKGNAEQLDKMAANTYKLYQEYFKIKKELEEEKSQNIKGKGGKNKSLTDSGLM
jgi:hypothetical protein